MVSINLLDLLKTFGFIKQGNETINPIPWISFNELLHLLNLYSKYFGTQRTVRLIQ